MALALSTSSPVSQRFAGAASAEPPGWYINDTDGRPLKASRTKIAEWIYRGDYHQGLDQYAAAGTNLYAIEAGKVISVDSTYGQIIVEFQGHPDSRYSFSHCSSLIVPAGARVIKGQHIAEMGAKGNGTGSHNHLQIMFREKVNEVSNGVIRQVTRWIQYDPARFYPQKTYRFGSPYRAEQIAKGTCDSEGYLYGGSYLYDDRIYPIRPITVNNGSNVRLKPDTTSTIVLKTTAVTPAMQINEVPGGEYEIAGTKGTLWAKIKLTVGTSLVTGYVAKPLIKLV